MKSLIKLTRIGYQCRTLVPHLLHVDSLTAHSTWRYIATSHVAKIGIKTSTRSADSEYHVYISSSDNIYLNLALEDWIEKHVDLEQMNILLLWRNTDCVVIGRHQNPWTECNIPLLLKDNVPIARRRSGGGCVYHDRGNLNLSFFTSKANYNRSKNLNFVASVLKSKYGVHVDVNDRDDIILDNQYKVSGTAARLTKVAYHHFTLLVNMNTEKLSAYLSPSMEGLKSNATDSVRSKVKNLQEGHPHMEINGLIESISDTYLKRGNLDSDCIVVDPSNSALFPGIDKFYSELKSWQWIYGKTPKFSVSRSLSKYFDGKLSEVYIELDVDKGFIINVSVSIDSVLSGYSKPLTDLLQGVRFWPQEVSSLLATVINDSKSSDSMKCITSCIESVWL